MSDKNNLPAVVTNNAALSLMQPILDTLPTLEDDPTERMMAAILEAASAGDANALFDTWSLKDSAGEAFRFNTIRAAESQYGGRLGFFLVADVVRLKTGEAGVMTVGGDIAIAQLLNCWKRQDFPHDFEVVEKPTPTKAGFKPIRLRSMGRVVTAGAGA
ncbi:MAG TPA: hypothetical protein VNL71_21075 [Chloroflexota bacterium]|nr:hypothetical protein [Chloroflexota bacterium]